MRELYLGIDSGTQSTKALVVDAKNGKVLGSGQRAYGFIKGLPAGAKEQHPETWKKATTVSIKAALKQANATAAEGGVAAPVKRQVRRVVGPLGGRAKPQVPVQSLRHLVLLGLQGLLLANLTIDILESIATRMHLGDLPNRPRPDQFTKESDVIRGMSLIADLGDYLFV